MVSSLTGSASSQGQLSCSRWRGITLETSGQGGIQNHSPFQGRPVRLQKHTWHLRACPEATGTSQPQDCCVQLAVLVWGTVVKLFCKPYGSRMCWRPTEDWTRSFDGFCHVRRGKSPPVAVVHLCCPVVWGPGRLCSLWVGWGHDFMGVS